MLRYDIGFDLEFWLVDSILVDYPFPALLAFWPMFLLFFLLFFWFLLFVVF
jgi:hypothetical protein